MINRGTFLNLAALLVALLGGIAIAYVDSRPAWDDTGITAFSMLLLAVVVTLTSSLPAWLVALCVGAWIPGHALALSPSVHTLPMLLVLLFPLAGAWAGSFGRRALERRFAGSR
jgi:hypothetical protein